MPLTLPATRLHPWEKFMCQLGVLLPSWILPTPLRDYPPRHESACSFITAAPQVRFISKRRTRCGLHTVVRFAEEVKAQLGGHSIVSGIFWVRDGGKAGGESRKSRQCVEKLPPGLLRGGFGSISKNNSVSHHLSVSVLAGEGGMVGFPAPWVKQCLSHCEDISEMRKFSVSGEQAQLWWSLVRVPDGAPRRHSWSFTSPRLVW